MSAAMALSLGCLPGRPVYSAEQVHAELRAAPNQAHYCQSIPVPPSRLETSSKYDQSVMSKSIIDEDAAARRRQALAPAEAAIGGLQAIANRRHSGRMQDQDAASLSEICLKQAMESWAAAGALTDMATKDANLVRDKYMATIADLLLSASPHGMNLSEASAIREWLSRIAGQIIAFYDVQAGPISRSNNHRYWAGLAIARIGRLLDDRAMLAWSRTSLEIGLCQIDRDGFLPLELARGAKAYDYHLYAYTALQSLADLMRDANSIDVECSRALPRLAGQVLRGEEAFALRTGRRQDPPARKTLMAVAGLQARATGYPQTE